MSVPWFFKEHGEDVGPFSAASLRKLARQGRILPMTWVRKGVDGKWIPAAKVKGLIEDTANEPIPCQLPEAELIESVPMAAPMADHERTIKLQPCPDCGHGVSLRATSCPSCGAPVGDDDGDEVSLDSARPNPGIAAILNFLLPGVGHMYLGRRKEGVGYLSLTLLYVFAAVGGYAVGGEAIVAGLTLFYVVIWISSFISAAIAEPDSPKHNGAESS